MYMKIKNQHIETNVLSLDPSAISPSERINNGIVETH